MAGAVALGRELDSDVAVQLEEEARHAGLYVIGKTGTGKTSLLISLVLQDAEHGHGLCFLDPHGDAIDDILSGLPEKRLKDMILLEPGDVAYPFGLNLFTCRDPADPSAIDEARSQVMHVFEKLWGPGSPRESWGPRLESILQNSTLTLLENPGMTMAELPDLLTNHRCRDILLQRVTNPAVRAFWETRFNEWPRSERQMIVESTLNKVDAFLSRPMVYGIVAQSESSVDFRQVMDTRKILLVRLPGDLDDVTTLLGSTIIAQLLQAALSRSNVSEKLRVPFYLYADEYHRFDTPDFARLLAEARKYRVASTVAHQWRSQLGEQNRKATLNTANMVVFRVIGGSDAEELAAQFDATPATVKRREQVLRTTRRAVDHLTTHGVSQPKVQEFVAEYLTPIARWARELGPKDYVTKTYTFWTTHASPEAFQTAVRQIDALYVDHMERRIEPFSEAAIRRAVDIGLVLRGYFVFFPEYLEHSHVLYGPRWTSSYYPYAGFADALTWYFLCDYADKKGELDDYDQMEELARRLGQACKETYREKWAGIKPQLQEDLLFVEDWIVKFDQGGLKHFIWQLYTTAAYFFFHPIQTATGEYEEHEEPDRTFADRRNEIANLLVKLDDHHAWCKILEEANGHRRTAEHVIKTWRPRRAGDAIVAESRKDRIRRETRANYCQTREAVLAEVVRRQAPWHSRESDDGPPPRRG